MKFKYSIVICLAFCIMFFSFKPIDFAKAEDSKIKYLVTSIGLIENKSASSVEKKSTTSPMEFLNLCDENVDINSICLLSDSNGNPLTNRVYIDSVYFAFHPNGDFG